TFGQLNIASNSATANTLTIGAGNTISATSFTFSAATTATNASIVINGGAGSALNIGTTNTNFIVGTDNAGQETASVNMAGLPNFSYTTGATGTGRFTVGFDGKLTSTLTL